MKESKLYLYVAGMATGVIMSVFSLFVANQVIIWVSEGGSMVILIITAMSLGLVIGAIISFIVNKIS
jgi:hypothetical protein